MYHWHSKTCIIAIQMTQLEDTDEVLWENSLYVGTPSESL
jgi:hypothetical protein